MPQYFLTAMFALLLGLGFAAPSMADEDEIFDSKHLDAVRVSLGQGLEIAERDSKGKAVKAEFHIEHGRPVWEVKMLSEAGLLEYEVDAESGRIAKIEDERVRGRLYSFVMGVRLKDIEAAKTSAIEAVATAERQTGAKTVSFEVEREYWGVGGLEYQLVLRSGNKGYRVRVDAATGQIVSQR